MRNLHIANIEKGGLMAYTSHLDMVRLLKNAFNIAGVKLVYSQGFNPHPKMSLAQPLPLGYSSICEILEFETKENRPPEEIIDKMNAVLPEGVKMINCAKAKGDRSISSKIKAAEYEIFFPDVNEGETYWETLVKNYLGQEKIPALKKQKKKVNLTEIDIKPMIKAIRIQFVDNNLTWLTKKAAEKKVDCNLIMYTNLDAGSYSNLSPELVISTFLSFSGLKTPRPDIKVRRTGIIF